VKSSPLCLVFVVGAIFSKKVAGGRAAAGLGPYLVGSLVWGIGLALGGQTGYAINRLAILVRALQMPFIPIAGKRGPTGVMAPIP